MIRDTDREGETERQRDRETERQTDRQTARQTGRQADRQTDGETDGETESRMTKHKQISTDLLLSISTVSQEGAVLDSTGVFRRKPNGGTMKEA